MTDTTFQTEVLASPQPVVVDFWAEWCGPCRQMSSIIEAIAADSGDALKVVKVNIDHNPWIVKTYDIQSVPTLVVFQDGEPVKRIVGGKPKAALMRDFAAITGTD